MCRELDALRQSITDYGARFDARSLTASQASEVVRLCMAIKSSVASIEALAAAVVAESESWKREGFRSSAEQLAAQTGTTTGRARRILETGRRMSNQPEVARAALAGMLSPDQASAVAEGVEANPARCRDLIDKARTSSMGELNDEVARTKAAASDLEERRRRIHARRALRFAKDLDGTSHISVTGHPEDGTRLYRMIAPIRRRLNVLGRDTGDRDTMEALSYDALMTMARLALGEDVPIDFAELRELGLFPQVGSDSPPGTGATAATPPSTPADLPTGLAGSGPSATPDPPADPPPAKKGSTRKLDRNAPKVIVHISLDALLRGDTLEGEVCEITGFGPVSVSVVKELLAHGNTFVAAALMHHEQTLGTYHHRRHPNAHQRTALQAMYPTCAVKGCNVRVGLEADHREDWAKTHYTVLDLLDQLCAHHHRLKSRQDWALVEGKGKRAFVPPSDPRHPRHSRSARQTRPPGRPAPRGDPASPPRC